MRLDDYLHEFKIGIYIFAKKSGVSPQTVYRVIHNEGDRITMRNATKICKATKWIVKLEDLLPVKNQIYEKRHIE